MSLETLGKNISTVEVTNISNHGIWLLSGDNELFLSYDDFPWFKDDTVKHILNFTEMTENQFYWPYLYIDFNIDIINHPERFPLVFTEA